MKHIITSGNKIKIKLCVTMINKINICCNLSIKMYKMMKRY